MRGGDARPGTTLVELMVALLLLTVGILATAGTSRAIGMHLEAALTLDHSAWLAASQLDSLRALDCTRLRDASGATVARSGVLRLSWRVERDSSGAVRLSSEAVSRRGVPLALRTVRTCPPP